MSKVKGEITDSEFATLTKCGYSNGAAQVAVAVQMQS